jgi:tyrosyl-tRNA synthetase
MLADVLVEVGFADSKSDARRTIVQGGVKVDGKVVDDAALEVGPGSLIQKGKRFFVRIV